MILFPFALVRSGGETFETLASIDSGIIANWSALLDKRRQHVENLKSELCQSLLSFIDRPDIDPYVQRKLQNIRRDIYNQRVLKVKQLGFVYAHLDEVRISLYDHYQAALHEFQVESLEFEALFDAELRKSRDIFRKHAGGSQFQKGLLLSSRLLSDSIAAYLESKSANSTFTKKDQQVETGLLKYMTRAAAKTSPFSTFCNLSLVDLTAQTGHGQIKDQCVPESVVRINNMLYRSMLDAILQNPSLSRHLPVQANRTISEEKDQLLFLFNNNNVETFQRVQSGEVLLYVIDQARSSIRLQDLVERVASDTNTSFDETEGYIRALISYGLLEFEISVSGLDPDWMKKISSVLSFLSSDPAFNAVLQPLEKTQELLMFYPGADIALRRAIIDEIQTEMSSILTSLSRWSTALATSSWSDTMSADDMNERTPVSLNATKLIYEDSVGEWAPKLCQAQVEEWVRLLDALQRSLAIFDPRPRDMAELKFFFQRQYPDLESVGLLQFYEDYYRSLRSEKPENDTGQSLPADAIVMLQGKWHERFQQEISKLQIADTEQVDLSISLIKRINDELGLENEPSSIKTSKAAFVQFCSAKCEVSGESSLMGVLNTGAVGYGKMLSRFLHLFPDSLTNSLRDWNRRCFDESEICMETNDCSFFNANIHPPLFPYEVKIPNGQTNRSKEWHIEVADLKVCCREEENELQLRRTSDGKRVYSFDLGFQGRQGRSALFKLLDKFTLRSSLFIHPVVLSVNQYVDRLRDSKAAREYPRIVFDGKIVLQRRQWLVSRDALPQRDASDTNASFYLKVNAWRMSLGIPARVFIILPSQAKEEDSNIVKNERTNRDDYKPQYISFESPLLLLLFERLLNKVSSLMRIEEMWPDPENLSFNGNQRYVAEHVLHWYGKE